MGSGLGSEAWGFEGLEGARLAHEHRLLAGAPLDGASHRAVARPLLRVGQMRDRVEVGHDELAARVLVDAQLVRVRVRVRFRDSSRGSR